MKSKTSEIYLIYIIALLEGASLMASEIIAAKLIAPFFGTSVYVWTAMLIITLGGMAIGYWLGGMLALKKIDFWICVFLLAVSLLLYFMPFFSGLFMDEMVVQFNIMTGALLSQIFFLLPLMIVFGALSPLLTQQFSYLKNNIGGESVSVIWGLSTVGGILGVLFTGIYSIPFLGIDNSCKFFAFPLLVILVFYFVFKRATKSAPAFKN
jgi:hypothetical protein